MKTKEIQSDRYLLHCNLIPSTRQTVLKSIQKGSWMYVISRLGLLTFYRQDRQKNVNRTTTCHWTENNYIYIWQANLFQSTAKKKCHKSNWPPTESQLLNVLINKYFCVYSYWTLIFEKGNRSNWKSSWCCGLDYPNLGTLKTMT